MTEFTKCEGAFAFLKHDQEKQSAILDCAAKTTKAWTHKTFTVGVDLAGFRRADRMYRVSEYWSKGLPNSAIGGAYSFAAGQCVGVLLKWLHRTHPVERHYHVFEKGDTGQGAFRDVLDRYDISAEFLRKENKLTGEWIQPFQAIDWIAWEIRRLYGAYQERRRVVRPSMRVLRKQLPLRDLLFTESGLLQMCIDNPELYPPR
jgi:hypothetical protein